MQAGLVGREHLGLTWLCPSALSYTGTCCVSPPTNWLLCRVRPTRPQRGRRKRDGDVSPAASKAFRIS